MRWAGREHFVQPLPQIAHPFDPASEIGPGVATT